MHKGISPCAFFDRDRWIQNPTCARVCSLLIITARRSANPTDLKFEYTTQEKMHEGDFVPSCILAGIDGFEPSKMPESKSGALPLGYIPIFITLQLYHKTTNVSIAFIRNYRTKLNGAFYIYKVSSIDFCPI